MELQGREFGRWVVLCAATDKVYKNGRKSPQWLCRCSCGTVRSVSQHTLVAGKSKSCGCLQKDVAKRIIVANRKKYNPYVIRDDYVIMYTFKNEPFFVDIEDFGRIKSHCWRKNDNGYLATTINHSTVYLHRMIMRVSSKICIDHIGGSTTKHDNRKINLRLANHSQNGRNKEIQSNNTSGYPGVSWDKQRKGWSASVYLDGKEIYLGVYKDKNDAINARRMGEMQYYGEYSYEASRKHYEGG